MMRGGREPIRRSRPRFPLIAFTLAVPAIALLIFLGYRFLDRPLTRPLRGHPLPVGERGKIVLILDDVGYNSSALSALTALGAKLNFAIIPGTPNARASAEMLAARGFEVLCHLPMEPLAQRGVSAGKGAILTSMSDSEIRSRTQAQFRAIPHARGANNHMGSRATANRRVMQAVIGALKDEGAYFVDSVTTADSVASRVAREMGVPAASREIFLDHQPAEAAVRRKVEELAELSRKNGIAIGIAHLHPATVKVLRQEIPRLQARGFRFVSAAEAVKH